MLWWLDRVESFNTHQWHGWEWEPPWKRRASPASLGQSPRQKSAFDKGKSSSKMVGWVTRLQGSERLNSDCVALSSNCLPVLLAVRTFPGQWAAPLSATLPTKSMKLGARCATLTTSIHEAAEGPQPIQHWRQPEGPSKQAPTIASKDSETRTPLSLVLTVTVYLRAKLSTT